ncbi:hypothetical protein PU629_08450 [Pullulanibacillus sp. KACC 23026]|uniref:hypothetical protein n=1 Tax=Pullulanibacillus sp. KACC 23026 TaxID=3028315 RepID=UPI0023AF0FD5|nr:hypothetical protein [Pullulanibacillus sp. KACC 23026]WEG14378.1 hypothetical protein PU629_08450 [Pullulanibacillus sp. KACC 23026]
MPRFQKCNSFVAWVERPEQNEKWRWGENKYSKSAIIKVAASASRKKDGYLIANGQSMSQPTT